MKKLSDYIGQKIAINFHTYELWLRRKEINPSDKLTDYKWEKNKEKTVYYVDSLISGQFGGLGFAEENGYTILSSTDFLEDEFIYGQEYEFSDDEGFKCKVFEEFLAKTKCGKFVSYNKYNKCVSSWLYSRKINTERTEAITTIKELVSKFSINQNEVF